MNKHFFHSKQGKKFLITFTPFHSPSTALELIPFIQLSGIIEGEYQEAQVIPCKTYLYKEMTHAEIPPIEEKRMGNVVSYSDSPINDRLIRSLWYRADKVCDDDLLSFYSYSSTLGITLTIVVAEEEDIPAEWYR